MLKVSLAVLIAATSSIVLADELKPWDVEVELGAIATSGNTQTTSINGKFDAIQNLTKFKNEYIVNSLFKQDDVLQDDGSTTKEKTADKYLISAKSAYSIGDSVSVDDKKSYLFGFASYTHDEFGAYQKYETVALGYGNWLYATDTLNWFVEAGPGYFRGEKAIQTDDLDQPYIYEIQQGALLRLATELKWKFSQTATFKQAFSVETSSENTRTLSETSVSASISNAMQMKISFAVASDSKVTPDKKKTDTTTSATLVYKF